MNREILYRNGEVIITDELGIEYRSEHIESIEKKLTEKRKELKKKKNYQKNAKKQIIWPVIIFFVASLAIPILLDKLLGINEIVESGRLFAGMKQITMHTIITVPIFTVIGGAMSLISFGEYKNLKKEIKGTQNEIYFLKEELEENKNVLIKLNNTKNAENDKNITANRIERVEDRRVLENLRNHLTLLHSMGINEQKYLKYYQKGVLRKKLGKEWNEAGIKLMEKYIANNYELDFDYWPKKKLVRKNKF